ncbi:hypothetical protein W97_08468 [Coniosporium apollinis CBS 100218]|uniref:STAS domain-containing protein n=1 Tax=Coniosporium apollinis (strain CBS 100218) TaxID=1168221 RepID=R7Z5C1_CONA1|nr:uncharacterized protein W97_08468 [Coniosporium apollinis CBS 100218]EON69209.1 hypothetical protein W97_08468 [Coniosporium apollinis CBS 100218]
MNLPGTAPSSQQAPVPPRSPSFPATRQHEYAPINPSQLREAHSFSSPPEDVMSRPHVRPDSEDGPLPEHHLHAIDEGAAAASSRLSTSSKRSDKGKGRERASSDTDTVPNARTRLLNHANWDRESGCGKDDCAHGTFSPRPNTLRSYGSTQSSFSLSGFGGRYSGALGGGPNNSMDPTHADVGDSFADSDLGGDRGKQMSTTEWLAKQHGIKNRRLMYLAYYIPIFNWLPQYKWEYLRGDLIAALTMASFYLPMSLSYASNLGHLPPINGLYSFVFNPFMYAILGSCPQMVVGPEAAGSLLTGEVVRENIRKGTIADTDGVANAEIAGAVTCMAGLVIFIGGALRLGFLDNVLSRPFLRGFISAIGIVIFVDQLIPETGLAKIVPQDVSHGSCLDKIIFLCRNIGHAHGLTTAVSLGSFAIIMVCREVKKRLQPRFPTVAYIPDRFLVVVLSAVFTWHFEWEKHDLEILGNVQTGGSKFAIHFPFAVKHLKYVSDAASTSFVIALLGFFESSVAAKSLGGGGHKSDGIRNVRMSANRELWALGVANLIGGMFMALPAFGGYGRSKVNASTGGTTPMSSIFLSLITVICITFLLPYFYYIPKGVLSAMISVVAYSLIEEAPHDIRFFARIRGYSELLLMSIIFLTTVFWNLKIGISVGIGLSALRLIKHATRPRIQILGRVLGTEDRFENVELDPEGLEFIEGCLIVKIPEPLTFANTGELKQRLKRLEEHGTGAAHPALPRVRHVEQNRNVVFDVHGVTSLDGAGAQVMAEIVKQYRDRDVRVFFCRISKENREVWPLFARSGIVEMCGGEEYFLPDVKEALRRMEREAVGRELGLGVLEGEHGWRGAAG